MENRVRTVLGTTFGFDSFLPLQAEILEAIVRGQDVFALMPTGGGKSLCYQLPALVLDGVTVVVSPLIALMKDQVDNLRTLGVPATYINSSLTSSESDRRQEDVVQGRYALVYVAPERLNTEGFRRLLQRVKLTFFAVDEAHCISEWGHDFRPDYRRLSELRTLFPDVPLAAFTATATERVQADIVKQLGLRQPARFRGSFNRHNLYYDVRPGTNRYEKLASYLHAHPRSSGIIYCFSRKNTEDLARRLTVDGFPAAAYHAGLEPEDRQRRQEGFARDEVPIIVATIAFGMGIDKSDVRFVVHYDLPKSLEGYYQESGRAGRDGEPADCILFFNSSDVVKQRRFIQEKPTAEERRIAEWQLREMADWAERQDCRRRALLAYFGEKLASAQEPCCDNCSAPVETTDYTIPAQMFLSCVVRTSERFGAGHVTQVLRGANNEAIRSRGHDQLSTYAIGRERSENEWRYLARSLVRDGVLREDAEYHTLTVTPLGQEVLFKGRSVMLPAYRSEEVTRVEEKIEHEDLFVRLRERRKQLADERDVPPYVIFSDAALKHVAAVLPSSPDDLRTVPGIGERKIVDFGADILAEVAEYVRQTGARPAPPPLRLRRMTPGGTSDSVQESLRMHREGQTLETIASTRGMVVSTIEGHLAAALEAGQTLDMARLVSPDRRELIAKTLEDLGSDYLAPVKEYLGDDYTYGELKLVRAWLQSTSSPGQTTLREQPASYERKTSRRRNGKASPSESCLTTDLQAQLFDRLRLRRKRLADDLNVAPFIVFHDSVLKNLAAAAPSSQAQLLMVPGIGPRKADTFGEAMLEEIDSFLSANPPDSQQL